MHVNTANINRLYTFILPFPYSVTKHTLFFKINTPTMKFKMCMELNLSFFAIAKEKNHSLFFHFHMYLHPEIFPDYFDGMVL